MLTLWCVDVSALQSADVLPSVVFFAEAILKLTSSSVPVFYFHELL